MSGTHPGGDDGDDRDPRAGLCGHCRHADRIVSSRGTIFYLCRRSLTDPGFPKYPPLPLIACAGYEEAGPDRGGG